jgi:penicillin-insensitive murein endopeptidase
MKLRNLARSWWCVAAFAIGYAAVAVPFAVFAQVQAPAGAAPAVPGAAPATAPVAPPAAKILFGAQRTAAPLAARAIGSYAKGCLSGARQLAADGPSWQAMRLSRNRHWGHPALVSVIERLAEDARLLDGWPGLLVGDMSQPRGGPMLTGHASHQIGLDADIWFTPMPSRRLSGKEREDLSATNMLAGILQVNRTVFGEAQVRLLKRAASYPEVERVLVHPAIKRAVCEATAKDSEKKWLSKVRPTFGHDHHFHVRIGCPKDAVGCVAQAPTPGDDGCGKELADWYELLTRPPKTGPPEPPKPPIMMADLPQACRQVLDAKPDVRKTAK